MDDPSAWHRGQNFSMCTNAKAGLGTAVARHVLDNHISRVILLPDSQLLLGSTSQMIPHRCDEGKAGWLARQAGGRSGSAVTTTDFPFPFQCRFPALLPQPRAGRS